MSEAWYCKAFGQELGPMSFADLLELVERADVLPSDDVKCGEDGAWRAASLEARLFPQSDHDASGAGAGGAPAEPQALVATESAPETDTRRDAGATAANLPNEGLSQASDGQEAASVEAETAEPENPTEPFRGPLNRKLMAACATVLTLCGAFAGSGARLLLGDGSEPPASSSSSSAVEQQKIALLKQQIDDLKRQRDELESAAGSEASGQPDSAPPDSAPPSNSTQPSGSEPSPPSNTPPGAPAPTDGAMLPSAEAPSSEQASTRPTA